MPHDELARTLPARTTPHRYRDELNFAEFPIASVSDTIAENQKTLEFTDRVFDPSSGKHVERTLVITAADKFGLPTALDDEVLLGLIQLTSEAEFRDLPPRQRGGPGQVTKARGPPEKRRPGRAQPREARTRSACQ